MSMRATGGSVVDGQVDRFQLLVDAVTDYAICMLDPQGFVTSWNSGAKRQSGYAADEIIGRHFHLFFTADDQAASLPPRILAEARTQGRAESEGWHLRQDGSRFWAQSVVQPLRDATGAVSGFVRIVRDITERKAAEDALFESERRFRLLAESVADSGICMLDPSGMVINWNAGAERIKGYKADEIVGHHFSRFYSQEDRTAGLPALALDTAARQGRYETEGWRIRRDGGRFWAAVTMHVIRGEHGEILGYAKVTRDITERRMAQEVLYESERQFRLLMSGVVDYAIYMLDPNGIVTNWNAGAERIKGYSADEAIGTHFSRFYTESDRSAGIPAQALRRAAQDGRYEAEGWRVRRDGSLFWASVVIDVIYEGDKLVGYAKITRDITERRNAQRALQEAQVQIAQSQKMDALGQLTGGVAHDFNNILMIVMGYLGTIKRAVADNPKALQAVEAIEHASKRGESLTRQLLTFSRRQTLNPAGIDLRQTIASMHVMLSSSIGNVAMLVAKTPPDLWPVLADPNELELAIINLVLNSRDAMAQGGTITISAENRRLESSDTPAAIKGDFVALTVADTGRGIPADILPRVFDPFFTTKPADRGTGLGLSQAHGFAHQSGGTIAITSEIGQGTQVTIYLPRAAAVGSVAVVQDGPARTDLCGTALLVEDNPEVLRVTKALLEELGYRVLAVADATAALAALDRHNVDIVVSDIVMASPIDGFELARAIRKRKPSLPILLATGYSNVIEQAGDEFLVIRKPYQLTELGRAIARVRAKAEEAAAGNLIDLREVKRERGAREGS